jgi:hypothetical protein
VTNDLFVYSLEGCVRQGFLSRLKTFDWAQTVEPPVRSTRQVDGVRRAVRACLWATAHPSLVLVGLVGLVWVLTQLGKGKRG